LPVDFVLRRVQKIRRSHIAFCKGAPAPSLPAGHIPRVSRLMALAIRFDGLIHNGAVTDQS